MILIFEGLNAVGKSSLGNTLSVRWNIPFYRPFRRSGDAHGFYPDMGWMRSLGVPVNCYHEEVYISDFLRGVKCDVILNRSMPSAIVYGHIDRDLPDDVEGMEYLRQLWESNMIEAGATLVYFSCNDYDEIKRRYGDLPLDRKQYAQAKKLMDEQFRISKLIKIRLNAKIHPVSILDEILMKRLRELNEIK